MRNWKGSGEGRSEQGAVNSGASTHRSRLSEVTDGTAARAAFLKPAPHKVGAITRLCSRLMPRSTYLRSGSPGPFTPSGPGPHPAQAAKEPGILTSVTTDRALSSPPPPSMAAAGVWGFCEIFPISSLVLLEPGSRCADLFKVSGTEPRAKVGSPDLPPILIPKFATGPRSRFLGTSDSQLWTQGGALKRWLSENFR